VVARLLELMREAKARGTDIVVFPELALTTVLPR
jgi:predicted amidohydrolase